MKQKYIELYLDFARRAAVLSSGRRSKVGCVVVNDHNMWYGYNGTHYGADNNCEHEQEDGSLVTKQAVIHAELNALIKSGRQPGATMFCTLMPCEPCAAVIVQSGITTVYYEEDYRCTKGVDLLRKAGITVVKYEREKP